MEMFSWMIVIMVTKVWLDQICCLHHRIKAKLTSSLASVVLAEWLGLDLHFHVKCVFLTLAYIFFFLYSTLTKVLDVSIWKSPVAGWGWESIEAKDDWLRWLPVPFGLGFHLTMCVWPLPPLILGWPNRKPWWQQPFANRPGAMVRIAIGFYVDSKHKWIGSSKELTI